MASLIRRHSMERLELYDLDKLITIPTINHQLPPPLPPPRKCPQRRPSMNPIYERYKFLCNTTRNKTDPIYAATPMFTTIPQSSQEKSPRQLLGSYIRLENVKQLPGVSFTTPEPKSTEIIEEEKENEDNHKEVNGTEKQSDNGSSSSDEQKNDDDYTKDIIEEIINRDAKD